MQTENSSENLKEQIIQKAWGDPSFKKELLSDANMAIEKEFGVKIPEGLTVKALEETKDTVYFVIPLEPSDDPSEASGTGDVVGYV